MSGHFHFSPILHRSFVSEKWVKDFHVTEVCRRPEKLQLVLLSDGNILLYLRGFLGCCLFTLFWRLAALAFRWVFSFCHSNACIYVGKSAENSVELFRRHPDGGSLWEIETLLSLCVEASPGWHLVEGGCCLVGGFFARHSQGSPIWRWNRRELIHCFMRCCVIYILKKLTVFGITATNSFKESSSLKFGDEIKKVHWNRNGEETQRLLLK